MELELVQALLFCGAVFLSSLILTPLLCWVLLKPGHAAPCPPHLSPLTD
ncbi:MAG: hypothetical protein ACO4AJ_03285 [Prochlorothrix sp.]